MRDCSPAQGPSVHIRKTRYGTADQPVTLAFISGIDAPPELIGDAPPSQPPPPPEPKALRPPRWSDHTIRRMLGKDPKQAARTLNRVGFERTMRRIMREGT
jgi:hypothetical protein